MTESDVINHRLDAVEEDIKILYKKIEKIVLTKLDSREKEIIIKRFGLFGNNPQTQFELASDLKISRSYISRLEKKAIKTIKMNIIS